MVPPQAAPRSFAAPNRPSAQIAPFRLTPLISAPRSGLGATPPSSIMANSRSAPTKLAARLRRRRLAPDSRRPPRIGARSTGAAQIGVRSDLSLQIGVCEIGVPQECMVDLYPPQPLPEDRPRKVDSTESSRRPLLPARLKIETVARLDLRECLRAETARSRSGREASRATQASSSGGSAFRRQASIVSTDRLSRYAGDAAPVPRTTARPSHETGAAR